ncbi:CLUMA_CG014316, isoform A [Clunio marinus]|uniref:CLUMA_CG014316, isoform A n=1 Tax=Clunio marinus TaxID=568069 RepID=A0A1J1IMU2_9DIPT|nr:CLUMA_CG014316, isoform A [Clunio marinus]
MRFKVNNFLGCISLESGGLIIGWSTIVLSIIISLISIALIAISIVAFNGLNSGVSDAEGLALGRVLLTILIIIISIYLLISMAYFVAGILLVRSVKKRSPDKMMLFMALLAIAIFFSVLQLITSFIGLVNIGAYAIGGVIVGILIVAFDLYIFVCIKSLHDLFKKEKLNRMQGGQVQVQQPYNFQQQPTVVYFQQQQPYQQPYQQGSSAPQTELPQQQQIHEK